MKKTFIALLAAAAIALTGCETPGVKEFSEEYNNNQKVAEIFEQYKLKGTAEWNYPSKKRLGINIESPTATGYIERTDNKGRTTKEDIYDLPAHYFNLTDQLGRYTVAVMLKDMEPARRDDLIKLLSDSQLPIYTGTISQINPDELNTLAEADLATLKRYVDRAGISVSFADYNSAIKLSLNLTGNEGFKIDDKYYLESEGDSCTVVVKLETSQAAIQSLANQYNEYGSAVAIAVHFDQNPTDMYAQIGHFILETMNESIRSGEPYAEIYKSIGCRGVSISLKTSNTSDEDSFFVPLDVLFAEAEKKQ